MRSPLKSSDWRSSRGDVIGSPAAETNRTLKYVAGDRWMTGRFSVLEVGTVTLTRNGARPDTLTTT